MPYRQLPKSDADITRALDAAFTRWGALAATPEKRIITPAHFAQLADTPTSLRTRWKKEVGEASAALATQIGLTTAVRSAFDVAVQHINHFFITFDMAVERHLLSPGSTPVFNPEDRTYYERPANATSIPSVTTYADALLWGQRIKDGETARINAQGATGTPMAFPSAAEVETFVAALATLLSEQDEAQSTAADEARDTATLRPEADPFIRSMWNTIEFNLSEQGLTPSALRAEARLWGVVYVDRPGEEPDPIVPPAPTP